MARRIIRSVYCVIDTETTGLPLRRKGSMFPPPSEIDCYNDARILQIAWQIYNESTIIKERNMLVKPEPFTGINGHAFKVHGIGEDKINAEGVSFGSVAKLLHKDIKECSTVVGHNIDFDWHIIASEAYRMGCDTLLERWNNLKRYCTMKEGQRYLGSKKWPKLTELHREITGHDFEGAHDALADVKACAKCYQTIRTK